MKTLLRFLALFSVALVVLATGCLGAGFLWGMTHHRYDMPDSGAYYSSVDASFDRMDVTNGSFFSFRFRGKTSPHWTWSYRTNFAYTSLNLDWSGESGGGTAMLSLPSFRYQSSNSIGLLTGDTLAIWLLGATNGPHSNSEVERVQTVFSYLQAASQGTLPAPRHHGYHFDGPLHVSIYHFRLGFGVPWLVYFWVAVWLFGVIFFSHTLMKGRAGAQLGAAPNGGPAQALTNPGAGGGPPSVS